MSPRSNVITDDVTIRGLDRNEVILDGEFELDNGIRILGATGVVVENLTARPLNAFRGFKPAPGQEPELNVQLDVGAWAFPEPTRTGAPAKSPS